MSNVSIPEATLTTIAVFPEHSFLENLAVRGDGSVLITELNENALWFVPAAGTDLPVEPFVLHRFPIRPLAVVELEPDVFYICTSDIYTTHESHLVRLDLRGWSPGDPVSPEVVLDFPGRARGLNGACLVAARVLLVADSFASLIWRVDIPVYGPPSAAVWLEHESMGYFPGTEKPEQPGVNGLGYAERSRYLYSTSTAKKLFMRVRVDPVSLSPAGEPEHVNAGRLSDDFCIDEDASVAYVATHRQNTLDVVSLDPPDNSGEHSVVVGAPLDERLLGPSSGRWCRGPGDYGTVAYVTTDGGTTAPPAGVPVRPATLLRVELSRTGEGATS